MRVSPSRDYSGAHAMETESKIARRVRPTVAACRINPPSIRGRAVLVLVALLVAWIAPAGAVDGVLEINQTIVGAAGGFPYRFLAPGSYRLTGISSSLQRIPTPLMLPVHR